ncbi:MAG: MerR family transcriptional regulator [Actinomycetota bacterium]|nr:MerR family transcriptional regulator [Actinomycetota bacterium]
MPEERARTIGEVINLLKPEFPDITVSKVRFLEAEGLVKPHRSQSGYRQFGEADVQRLRYILQQQRDHFLPLKVIKSRLTAWERGESSIASPRPGPPPDAYFSGTGLSMSRSELTRASGLSRDQMTGLMEHGVLQPTTLDDGGEVFREEDLVVAREAQRLLSYGLEPRHVRSLRLSVEREADLLAHLTAPLLRHRNPETHQRAAETLAGCAEAIRNLQAALLRRELRDLLER